MVACTLLFTKLSLMQQLYSPNACGYPIKTQALLALAALTLGGLLTSGPTSQRRDRRLLAYGARIKRAHAGLSRRRQALDWSRFADGLDARWMRPCMQTMYSRWSQPHG